MANIKYQTLDKKVIKWIGTNHPDIQLTSLELLNGGQTNICYLINKDMVLKIFKSPTSLVKTINSDRYFRNTSIIKTKIDNTPQIIGVYENDQILRTSAILMKYIHGEALSNSLYNFDEKYQLLLGRKIAKTLKNFHNTNVLKNQYFDTQPLLEKLITKLYFAKSFGNPVIQSIIDYANSFAVNYKPRDIKTTYVTCHNDAHLNNFIVGKNRSLHLIDFDQVRLAPSFMEAKTIINSCLVPESYMTDNWRAKYSNLTFPNLLKSIIFNYPQLINSGNVEEVKLVMLTQLITRFEEDITHPEYQLIISWSIKQFDAIFKQNILSYN
jgi:thiamine kinase-like enzyme